MQFTVNTEHKTLSWPNALYELWMLQGAFFLVVMIHGALCTKCIDRVIVNFLIKLKDPDSEGFCFYTYCLWTYNTVFDNVGLNFKKIFYSIIIKAHIKIFKYINV